MPLILILICYYSLPVIIQGTFILDIDNTVLTPVLILLIYFGIRYLFFHKALSFIYNSFNFTTYNFCKKTGTLKTFWLLLGKIWDSIGNYIFAYNINICLHHNDNSNKPINQSSWN